MQFAMQAGMPVLKARKSIKVPKNNIRHASSRDPGYTALSVTKSKLEYELSGLSGHFAFVLLYKVFLSVLHPKTRQLPASLLHPAKCPMMDKPD